MQDIAVKDAGLLQSQPLTEYVASHPGAVWFVGPFFAAVTGVAFKEGVCYGKPECAVLFFITPALLLGGPSHSLETLCVCNDSRSYASKQSCVQGS